MKPCRPSVGGAEWSLLRIHAKFNPISPTANIPIMQFAARCSLLAANDPGESGLLQRFVGDADQLRFEQAAARELKGDVDF